MKEFKGFIELDSGVSHEFMFSRISLVEEKCLVIVLDKDNKYVLFYMKSENKNWKFFKRSDIPQWILGLEEKLSETIISNNLFSK